MPAAELAINSTPSLATGYAPFDLVYITHPSTPPLPSVSTQDSDDRLAVAKACLEAAWQTALRHAEDQKSRFDARHCPLPALSVGDRVFIRLKDRPVLSAKQHAKLDPSKMGPFPVKEVVSRHRVRLDLPADLHCEDLFDVSQLEQAPSGPDPFNRPLDAPAVPDGDGTPRYEVEAIVGKRRYRQYNQFQVKWKGDPRTTWEFEDDLIKDGCEALIAQWKERKAPTSTLRLADSDTDTALEERPIAFISTATSASDAKLVGLELEISGLAWAVHALQHFLEGAVQIIVVTDHAPLGAVLRSPTHSLRQFTPRIERLRAYLMPYLDVMEFVHKAGRLHSNVDALSRLPPSGSTPPPSSNLPPPSQSADATSRPSEPG